MSEIELWGQREQIMGMYEIFRDCPARRKLSRGAALAFLAGELSFGGHLFGVTEERGRFRIETRVQVFAKLDTTWFEGPFEAMSPLLDLVSIHSQFRTQARLGEAARAQAIANQDEIVTKYAAMVLGDFSTKAALLTMMGVRDGGTLSLLSSHTTEDLCAAWELNSYRIEGMRELLGEGVQS